MASLVSCPRMGRYLRTMTMMLHWNLVWWMIHLPLIWFQKQGDLGVNSWDLAAVKWKPGWAVLHKCILRWMASPHYVLTLKLLKAQLIENFELCPLNLVASLSSYMIDEILSLNYDCRCRSFHLTNICSVNCLGNYCPIKANGGWMLQSFACFFRLSL